MEEYFPEDRRDQFIYRGKKVHNEFFVGFAIDLTLVLRSSLNVRSTTIIRSR